MKERFAIVLCLAFFSAPVFAANLGTPSLSAPLATASFLDVGRLLTTGGVKYTAANELTLEPEWGVGYRATEREIAGGVANSIHRVHAQAGGRLSLAESLYLSAAAKLPVYTFESSDSYGGQALGSRQGYDVLRSLRGSFTWTGEIGIHLSRRTDLSLYYDQGLASASLPGTAQQDERIGTRLIWRFK